MAGRIWISWEDHRRSRELSFKFNAEYYPLVYDASRPVRYFVLTARTLRLIKKQQPNTIFCQNPSIVLASLLVFLKFFLNFNLVVDRHSNFKLEHEKSSSLKWCLFHYLSRFTLKNADLTIVTNEPLKMICENFGGKATILQDMIPRLFDSQPRSRPTFMTNSDKKQVMFVTMFDNDEPIHEMIYAAKLLPQHKFYFTGKYTKILKEKDMKNISENIVLTGFIPDDRYLALMENCDLVVVLTKKDLILNCGAYEALSFDKPLILSDTPTLRGYFGECATFTLNDHMSISRSIEYVVNNKVQLISEAYIAKLNLEKKWNRSFERVVERINQIER